MNEKAKLVALIAAKYMAKVEIRKFNPFDELTEFDEAHVLKAEDFYVKRALSIMNKAIKKVNSESR